jgi:hypothetical protein
MPSLKIGPAYWISTGLIALNFTFGGISSVVKSQSSLEVFRHLGYPDYFAVMLGGAQLLGVAAILGPVPRTLREWAYAGLTFDASAAAISLLAIGTSISQVIFPIIALGLIAVSYWTWRSRSDPGRNPIRC